MFSGLDEYKGAYPATRESLELAKQNFLRFSCVMLLEQDTEISFANLAHKCLATRLGLHLKSEEHFNVHGKLNLAASNEIGSNNRNDIDFEELTSEERTLLLDMNQLDLEFFEWAKDIIPQGI